MSTQRLAVTGLMIIALLAPGMSLAEPASKADSASGMPADDDYPPPDWTFGPTTGTLAAAGDLNGDGYDDAILVDPQASAWTRAVARVFYGSPTGLGSAPNWVLTDHWQTCAAGDVNGDGFDDLFAGSLQGLQVFYGSPAGPTPGTPWRGPSVSLSPAGDVNGDGYDDLLVGDPYFTDGQEWEGQMLLYYGSPAGPSTDPDWALQGETTGSRLGEKVLAVGDVNGDGYDDIANLGHHNGPPPYYYLHTVLSIYHGPLTGPAATVHDWTTEHPISVATGGDVDGDGYDDLVIGDPDYPCGGSYCTNWGEITLYRGSATGLSGAPDWRFEGDRNSSRLGRAVAMAGDLNGDGYDDVVAGAPSDYSTGRVLAFYGSPRGLAPVPHWIAQHGEGCYGFGDQLSLAGDLNGDGYDDLLAGHHTYQSGCANFGLIRGFYGTAAGLRGSRMSRPTGRPAACHRRRPRRLDSHDRLRP